MLNQNFAKTKDQLILFPIVEFQVPLKEGQRRTSRSDTFSLSSNKEVFNSCIRAVLRPIKLNLIRAEHNYIKPFIFDNHEHIYDDR